MVHCFGHLRDSHYSSTINCPLTLVSLFYVAQAVVSSIAFMIGGYLADFLGRVRTMVISAVASSIALLIAYAVNKPLIVVLMVLTQSFFNNAYGVANTSIVGGGLR